jgi:hypothetical protein
VIVPYSHSSISFATAPLAATAGGRVVAGDFGDPAGGAQPWQADLLEPHAGLAQLGDHRGH